MKIQKKIGLPRLLIVGCGDIGLRLLPWVRNKFRVYAVTTQPARCGELRTAGAIPVVVDLDRISSQLIRLAQLAETIIHLAPPNASKNVDFRTRHLISVLPSRAKVIYISTTGVYGEKNTDTIDETSLVHPVQQRSVLRVDAEQALRQWAIRQHGQLSILRVAGIYAEERLPVARIQRGEPVLIEADDGLINLIHAEDLAHIIWQTMFKGQPQRVYNVCDNQGIPMGSYMTSIAQHYGWSVPPRMPLNQLKKHVSATMLSMMTSVRHIKNTRLKTELGITLRYPAFETFLKQLPKE